MRPFIAAALGCAVVLGVEIGAAAATPHRPEAGHRKRSTSFSVSQNSLCGAYNGTATCAGSSFGRCCSVFGYCGNTDLHCGINLCQAGYGACGITTTSTTSTTTASSSTSSTSISTSTAAASTSTSASSTSTSASSAASCTASKWTSGGCYSDVVYDRTLPNRVYPSSATTIENCQAACAIAGYSIAGLEYYNECYCGNSIQGTGSAMPAGDTQCYSTPCTGNTAEFCGGPNRLSVFFFNSNPCSTTTSSSTSTTSTFTTLVSTSSTIGTTTSSSTSTTSTSTCGSASWTSLGCYSDVTYNRSLPNRLYPSSATTIENCQAACAAAGYSIAGLEYYNECYCGNAIQGTGTAMLAGDAQCNSTPCTGNANEFCGGPNRLSVFSLAAAGSCSSSTTSSAAASSTTKSTSTTSSTTTSSAAASSTATSVPSGVAGWTYLGCYSDSSAARALSVAIPASGSLTLAQCQNACTNAGNYNYAGTEYASECYCGYNVTSSVAADNGDEKCNYPCSGNSAQTCGGPNRLSMFQYTGPARPALTPSLAPSGTGDGAWGAAYAKANTALAQLANADKIKMVTGMGWQAGPCVGNTAAVPAIGYPELCLQDGPLGIRFVQGTTVFPAGVHMASTWDTSLMYAKGFAHGSESKALGIHVQLGPVAGPLGKFATGGRNWEGFAADPYLTGIAMSNTINGMQDAGVQACAKHFLGNEQETNREFMTAQMPDRAAHELYLWPFADAVKANVAVVMSSYNLLNNTYTSANLNLLGGLLKGELDFQGWILSDWYSQPSTAATANAGLDMSQPGDQYGDGNFIWGQKLLDAINYGTVPQARLDDMVRRILASWYFLGQDKGYPTVTGWSSWNGGAGGPNVQGTHASIVRTAGRDGIVLLKNTKSALPLSKPASLAIIGQDAFANPSGLNSCADASCDIGTLIMGWGSGAAGVPYLITPYAAISTQATTDGTTIVTSTTDQPAAGASAASAAATAIVFINADSGEGYINVEGVPGDRPNLDPWHSGNDLVAAVANVNPNTIVVIHSVGPVILESILANPNVAAVVWAGLPGQESGNSLVDILYGSVSPSGKLPYTIAKQMSDYGTTIDGGQDLYAEGLYIDYRHFDKAGITPRYEFGFGLSYTTFAYSALTTAFTGSTTGSTTPAPGGATGLYDIVATVTAKITNTGAVTGKEVAQLYIGLPASAPDSPPKQLRGFQKISLTPGASGTVTFSLRRKDLSYWDVVSQAWIVPSGAFNVYVGASSRDIRLTGTM